MAFIKWDDNLCVRVEEIDRQHQKLIGMINELHDAMGRGQGREVLQKIIVGLAEYTQTHFATEEKFFDQFAYSEAEDHKQEHKEFVKRVAEFKDGFEKGKHGVSIEVMLFLKEWINNHIKGSDKKYSGCFNEHGLK